MAEPQIINDLEPEEEKVLAENFVTALQATQNTISHISSRLIKLESKVVSLENMLQAHQERTGDI